MCSCWGGGGKELEWTITIYSKFSGFIHFAGLPPDVTKDEFIQVMSKCGIIMLDPQTDEPKIKLYKDKEGNLKGDGLCCYLKVSGAIKRDVFMMSVLHGKSYC